MTAGQDLRDQGTTDVIAAERWLPLAGWEHIYEVSDRGRIRRFDDRHVSEWVTPNGYHQVGLYDGNGHFQTKRSIHTLVLTTFIGARPTPQSVTRHLDGNRSNNHLQNLAWGTQSENGFDTVRHGHHTNAEKTHCPSGHAYDEVNTRYRANGHRVCRECDRTRCRMYYQRRNLVWRGTN